MHLSVVPNRENSFMRNSEAKRKGSMSSSRSLSASRVFSSRMKSERSSVVHE